MQSRVQILNRSSLNYFREQSCFEQTIEKDPPRYVCLLVTLKGRMHVLQ